MTVELNKIIKGREFDLYWEFEFGGITYRNVMECKDYTSKISVEKIDSFLGKTRDIPDLHLIYATKTGYQSGAIERAKQYNISLLRVRGCNDGDFITEDGKVYLKKITIDFIPTFPPQIVSFNPTFDLSWIKSQPHLNKKKIQSRFERYELTSQSFISNKTTNTRYSMMQLMQSLEIKSFKREYNKIYTHTETFENAFIELPSDNFIVKILGYNLTYIFKEPQKIASSELDLTQQIMGIIHNYITGKNR
ncbi:unnamed protein product [Commensalibacter communis]|uniref:hypothetical protein n=1 Tax=Commensalibacter communis TaxID=2972786 RepID=UPI0022FF7053|nr:hypothetical protein [Commensalibacter communis]CAI3933523.1 unnamed protein product [Commensalibacter communis]